MATFDLGLDGSQPGLTSTTSSVRGPCTPSTRWSSMSLVADGPLIHVIGRRGSRRAIALQRCAPDAHATSRVVALCSGQPIGARRPWLRPSARPHEGRMAAQPASPAEAGWPRLVLLRHGATGAPPGIYLGSRDDPPLSARGVQQARRAGVRLAGRSFRLVLVSPLRRARETGALAMPAARPTVDRRLTELDMGDFTGLTWEQIKARDREAALRWRAGAAAPGGEDAWHLWRRTVELGLELADGLAGNENALLVAHSGPIRALIASARGRSPSDVRSVRVAHGGVRCVRLTPAVLERWRAIVAFEPPR